MLMWVVALVPVHDELRGCSSKDASEEDAKYAPRSFSVCVGVLVEAVPRYCHFWYRLFGPSQPRQFCCCGQEADMITTTLREH